VILVCAEVVYCLFFIVREIIISTIAMNAESRERFNEISCGINLTICDGGP